MAMIQCTECGKEISDKAINCVGCGAPVSQASVAALPKVVPTKALYNSGTDTFSGTVPLLVKLAVKSVMDVGWKVDSVDESSGLVSFTTGMTWGSFSGVSGSVYIEEVSPGNYSVTGRAKQNLRGGQLVALNLFNEADKKIEKVKARMKQSAV